MKPIFEPTASPAIIAPSITACGSSRKRTWSLHVPGSDSSPFTSTYFGLGDALGTNDHFIPMGKPAPPRPRSPLAFISAIIHPGIASGPFAIAFCTPAYPSSSTYLSIFAAPNPNRRLSTFTSSGWETRRGITSHPLPHLLRRFACHSAAKRRNLLFVLELYRQPRSSPPESHPPWPVSAHRGRDSSPAWPEPSSTRQ